MNRLLFTSVCLFLLSFSSFARADDSHNARFLVHLLDYLAHDYGGAVKDGQVLSDLEYNEQKEFAAHTLTLASEISQIAPQKNFRQKLEHLHTLILEKADEKDVAVLARALQTEALALTQLPRVPLEWPSLKRGAELYGPHCASCHGNKFDGKGPAGASLDPPPADFTDDAFMKGKSPFQEFNVIRLGVPGTGMQAFNQLSDDDVWALAFYVVSLRHGHELTQTNNLVPPLQQKEPADLLEMAATHSDDSLHAALGSLGSTENISLLRRLYPQKPNPLNKAKRLLELSFESFKVGDRKKAQALALQAYLEGIEPVEPRLKANDAGLVTELEIAMGEIRSAIDGGVKAAELETQIKNTQTLIDGALAAITAKPLDPPFIFAAASAILLREGFEAVLIILMLLGVLKKTGAHRAEHWVHGGWIAALGLGLVAWFFSGWLLNLSGAQREMMEALTSLLAVAVLLFVGFWLHNQTEIGRWKEFISTRVVAALENKNFLGLAVFAFIAVFREAFETVLFLRALWLEGGDAGKLAMLGGVVSSMALIFILAWLLLKFSVRLPLKRLFGISAAIMALLAVVLAGKGIHSLQEAGVVKITSLAHGLRGELLGLYPSFETVASQAVVLVGVFILWQVGRRGALRAPGTGTN